MDTVRVAISNNSVSIRLTYKQWAHIVDSHDYMAGNMAMELHIGSDSSMRWGITS